MCGRYQLGMEWDQLLAHYAEVRELFERKCTLPWYNQAPGQPSPVILMHEGVPTLRVARWGYPPLWVAKRGQDPWKARPLVNAKSEEARTKRTWSRSMRERRCLVPSTGFYEWVRKGKQKLPLHFRPPGGGVLTLGGIWTAFGDDDDEGVVCMSVLTTGPNSVMTPVHNRCPVILAPADHARWLDPETPAEDIDALCAPAADDVLEAVEVHTSVNGWKAFGPEVLDADWTWTERPA